MSELDRCRCGHLRRHHAAPMKTVPEKQWCRYQDKDGNICPCMGFREKEEKKK